MSRDLPAQPHLDHLRKQAKDLLRELRQANPQAQLSDAQYAVAREYGFASWPRLAAHVESLPRAADAGAALAPVTARPLVGTWTADVARSRRHTANPFQRATIQIAMVDDRVTFTSVVVDASGREDRSTNTMLSDGQEYASPGGYALTASWRETRILETVATKDGAVVGRGTYEVSADGTTLTITGDEQVIVCRRA